MSQALYREDPISRAVVLAGGLGTKLLPITKSIPKEMLPVGTKPILEHIVEELADVGITRVLFVVSPSKEKMIRDYFEDGRQWNMACDYCVQHQMRGPADAILHSETWLEDNAFLLAFGDNIIEKSPTESVYPTRRLIDVFVQNHAEMAVLIEYLSPDATFNHTVIVPRLRPPEQAKPFKLSYSDLALRKPVSEDEVAVVASARWVLRPFVFDYLRQVAARSDQETYLIDILPSYLLQGGMLWVVPLRSGERRNNIDMWGTYLDATIRFTRDILCQEKA